MKKFEAKNQSLSFTPSLYFRNFFWLIKERTAFSLGIRFAKLDYEKSIMTRLHRHQTNLSIKAEPAPSSFH